MSDPFDDNGVPVEPPQGASLLVGSAIFGPLGASVRAKQEQKKWCWAASAQMLRRCVRIDEKEQCQIAAQRLSRPCCSDRASCNVALPLDEIESLLAEDQLTSVRTRAQLAEKQFWDELYARRPLLIVDLYQGSNEGHARVVFGWQQLGSGSRVARVVDPAEAKLASVLFEKLQESA